MATPRKKPEIYKRGDPRRHLRLALTMSQNPVSTLNQLHALTGYNKQVILDSYDRLREYFGIDVVKDGFVYHFRGWGPVLKSVDGIEEFLKASEAQILAKEGASGDAD